MAKRLTKAERQELKEEMKQDKEDMKHQKYIFTTVEEEIEFLRSITSKA